MSAALPIAALAALVVATKLRRGSRSSSAIEDVKREALQLTRAMRAARARCSRVLGVDSEDFDFNEKIVERMSRSLPGYDFKWGNDRIVTRSAVDPQFVIKLAPTSSTNLDEAAAYHHAGPKTRSCMVPVLAHDEDGEWLIMEYAKPASITPSDECAKNLYRLGFFDLHDGNVAEDGRFFDYGEPVNTRGSAARS